MKRFHRIAALCGASLLAISACGSDAKSDDTTAPSATAATSTTVASGATVTVATVAPDTSAVAIATTTTGVVGDTTAPTAEGGSVYSVETDNGVVTLDGKPAKIISLAPTHTETLFAIGAGAQVVAVDDQSNFPAEAAAVKSDLSGFTPNIEAIAGYDPDLVVISDNTAGLADQLQALDIPVWVGPAADTLEDVYSEIQQLGVLTGNDDAASTLITTMQDDLDDVLLDVPDSELPITYYHELDNTYFSVTSDTFIGQLYSLANLQNIADGADASNPYPQLSSELIISSDPQLIFLADTKCCGESAETVAARDGWSDIAAVRNDGVIELDDDIASRWGPRVVDFLRTIVDAVNVAASAPVG